MWHRGDKNELPPMWLLHVIKEGVERAEPGAGKGKPKYEGMGVLFR